MEDPESEPDDDEEADDDDDDGEEGNRGGGLKRSSLGTAALLSTKPLSDDEEGGEYSESEEPESGEDRGDVFFSFFVFERNTRSLFSLSLSLTALFSLSI